MIRHKSGVDNKVSNALSQRVSLLISLQSEIIESECLKELYKVDEDFAEIWENCSSRLPTQGFHMLDGFLLKRNQLYVPRTFLREKLFETCMEAGLQDNLGETS